MVIEAETRLMLAGLSILRLDADQTDPGGSDLVWRVFSVDDLPVEPGIERANQVIRPAPDGAAIDCFFGYDGVVRCSFRVHRDGSVDCHVASGLSDHDLTGLFSEIVLRVVLHQRALPSFHAAALSRNGHAMMVMGDKGAGKSTLSAALRARGWEAVADDLVRVEDRGGWAVFPGARDGKLHADSAAALGLRPDAMALRWREAPEWDRLRPKHLFAAPAPLADPLAPVPLAAILVLGPRHGGPAAMEAAQASPLARVQGLVRHATPDPLQPDGPPPRYVHAAIAGLARDVPIHTVALADALDRIDEAAAAADALTEELFAS